ncbi:ribosomal RNA small subunit methyltransferase D [Candidatus Magnetoovum chiemensis]|nr:ribosomal RNA small subunit methyltransferase D [Candidatus Magnetoovum chiemensis]
MRIISGTCKGRKLTILKGMDIRPTSDRIRESIFNIIGQRVVGAEVLDIFAGTGAFGIECLSRGAGYSYFIDIAKKSCSIIEQNIELCSFKDKSLIIQHDALKIDRLFNKLELNFPALATEKSDVIKRDAFIKIDCSKKVLNKQKQGFDIIFIDPPYDKGFVEKILKQLILIKDILKPDCLIILEHSIKEQGFNKQISDENISNNQDFNKKDFNEQISNDLKYLEIKDQRKYGKTLISFMAYREE